MIEIDSSIDFTFILILRITFFVTIGCYYFPIPGNDISQSIDYKSLAMVSFTALIFIALATIAMETNRPHWLNWNYRSTH